MDIRKLEAGQVDLLREGLLDLARHHNSIPSPFAGVYPTIPVEETLEEIAKQVAEGRAQVEAIFEGDRMVGFYKVVATRTLGTVDLLFVFEDCRGKGYGGRLLERALVWLRERGVNLIDIRVVDGNPAQRLYEKFGFRTRSTILSRQP